MRKPRLENRCARGHVTPDHVAVYRITSSQSGQEYFTCIDLLNGRVECSCPDFNCRRFPRAREEHVRPDIGTPRYQCKHIQAAVRDCIERGEIILQLKGTTA
jgi:hypothetical protein